MQQPERCIVRLGATTCAVEGVARAAGSGGSLSERRWHRWAPCWGKQQASREGVVGGIDRSWLGRLGERAARPRDRLPGDRKLRATETWEIVRESPSVVALLDTIARSSWRVRGGAPVGFRLAQVSWRTPSRTALSRAQTIMMARSARARQCLCQDRNCRCPCSTPRVPEPVDATDDRAGAPPARPQPPPRPACCFGHATCPRAVGTSRGSRRPDASAEESSGVHHVAFALSRSVGTPAGTDGRWLQVQGRSGTTTRGLLPTRRAD